MRPDASRVGRREPTIRNGTHIVICTATTSPKLRAISARPNVAVTIDVGDTPEQAKAVLVRGVATMDIVDGVPEEFLAGSTKTLNAEQAAEFERHAGTMYEQMARIAIEPQWVRFFDFGAGRLPSSLEDLAKNAS
jgi:hypothetical protein